MRRAGSLPAHDPLEQVRELPARHRNAFRKLGGLAGEALRRVFHALAILIRGDALVFPVASKPIASAAGSFAIPYPCPEIIAMAGNLDKVSWILLPKVSNI